MDNKKQVVALIDDVSYMLKTFFFEYKTIINFFIHFRIYVSTVVNVIWLVQTLAIKQFLLTEKIIYQLLQMIVLDVPYAYLSAQLLIVLRKDFI